MNTHIITLTRTTDSGVSVTAVARTTSGAPVDFSEAGIPFHVTVTAAETEEPTMVPPDTTDLRAWLDGLPIGADIVDVVISDTETYTGYWEATKIQSDVFIATNGFRWNTVDLVDGVSDYRLLVR